MWKLILSAFLMLGPMQASLLHAQRTALADSLRRDFLTANDPLQKADSYYDWAYLLLESKPETGLLTADTLEQMARRMKSDKNFSRAAYLRGMAHSGQGHYQEALPEHRRELAFALKTQEPELHGKALNSLGNAFHNLGINDSAIVYLIRSAAVKEQLGNLKDLAACYANIGNVFSDEKAPEKAIEYLEKALKIRLSLPKGERSAIITYNNLSVAYGGAGQYDKAIEYAGRGYTLALESDNKFLAGVLAGSLSHLWLEKNDPGKSIEMGEQSVALLSDLNRRANIVYPYATLADAWMRKGDSQRSLEINNKGYAIMEELKLQEPLEAYYKNFANAYERLGDYRQSLLWFRRLMVLDDSLFSKEKIEAIAQAEARYENQKKEAQLARQQLAIERAASRQRSLIAIAGLAILLLAGSLLYVRSRQAIRRKEAELSAQLEHAEAEKLRELDSMKSAFFANISHEFRTPLTLIVGPVEQMLSGSFKGDLRQYYRMILRNGQRLLQLVNQLLELSKLESGKMKLQAGSGDLARFVAGLAGSFESLAVSRQIHYVVEIPEAALPCFFDRDMVEKIFSNLLSNAFKFTDENGRVRISLLRQQQDGSGAVGKVWWRVEDSGMGIPAEQLPHLFERFTQSSLSEIQQGSGIGLALSKELAELHGGDIEVESQLGKGTAFTVSLTVGRAFFKEGEWAEKADITEYTAEKVIAAEAESGGATALPAGYRKTYTDKLSASARPLLLLAEDNPDVRLYISDTLRDHYQIVEAENGRIAWEKALELMPDLIVTDVMMPEMNGIEFCRQLRQSDMLSHIPVIMLTAKAEQDDKLQGLETGADDYLVKPFDPRELLARAANLIAQRKNLQEAYRRNLSPLSTAPIQAESMDAAFLRKVRDAIEHNLDDENFSVEELSKEMAMSRSQLQRKLSALTGYSPNEAIRFMRLEKARQLLEQKAGTAAEISFRCGFSSPAYFSKCFKDHYGITPGEV